MKTIAELKDEIERLKAQTDELQTKLRESIYNAMLKVSRESETARKKVGDKMFTVKHSDMIGNVWNPEFYDWEQAAECVYKYLEHKDADKWIDILKEKLEESKDKTNVVFDMQLGVRRLRIPINYKFIELIIEEISKN